MMLMLLFVMGVWKENDDDDYGTMRNRAASCNNRANHCNHHDLV